MNPHVLNVSEGELHARSYILRVRPVRARQMSEICLDLRGVPGVKAAAPSRIGSVISLLSGVRVAAHATEKRWLCTPASAGIHMWTWQPGRGFHSRTMSMVTRTASPGLASTWMRDLCWREMP